MFHLLCYLNYMSLLITTIVVKKMPVSPHTGIYRKKLYFALNITFELYFLDLITRHRFRARKNRRRAILYFKSSSDNHCFPPQIALDYSLVNDSESVRFPTKSRVRSLFVVMYYYYFIIIIRSCINPAGDADEQRFAGSS